MTNAFEIPKQSTFTKDRARTFFKNMPTYKRNMKNITLPNSNKFPPPELMKKPDGH